MLMMSSLFLTLNCLGHLIVIPCVLCHIHNGADNESPQSHDHHHDHNPKPTSTDVQQAVDPNYFLLRIFEKYGDNGAITRENFDHYLESLGLLGGDNHHVNSAHGVKELMNSNVEGTVARLQADPIVSSNAKEIQDGHNESAATKPKYSHNVDEEENGILVNAESEKCRSSSEILQSSNIDPSVKAISPKDFTPLCPVILYELGLRQCVTSDGGHRHDHDDDMSYTKIHDGHVFLYSSLAVLVISVSGILCVAIVPVIQKFFYHHFLHFFISLAVGSLTGDALLHLLPHAMTEAAESEHGGGGGGVHQTHNHIRSVMMGLTCLGGICVFYAIERLISALTQWRQEGLPTITVENDLNQSNGYKKVAKDRRGSQVFDYEKAESYVLQSLNKVPMCNEEGAELKMTYENGPKPFCDSQLTDLAAQDVTHEAAMPTLQEQIRRLSGNNTTVSPHLRSSVVRTDHVAKHHGHSHTHAHHKEVPTTTSALAWMVIAGDGLHNFSDGMAIGAAFASSVVVGLSTSIAVFCHELPHELGDFALLLKAGMKVRQALLYNTLSSILCFFGMLLGLYIGNISSANAWVFAAIAGMFLYVALVDMIPEMNSESNPDFGGFTKFTIQALGVGTGVAIMAIIAIYESDLQSLFSS